jgi:hypothetical protein
MSRFNTPRITLLAALALGWIWDLLFYGKALGISVLLLLVQTVNQVSDDDRQILSNHLQDRLERMEENSNWQRWFSFHLARWWAYNLLIKSQN